jgi:hypothetical protein
MKSNKISIFIRNNQLVAKTYFGTTTLVTTTLVTTTLVTTTLSIMTLSIMTLSTGNTKGGSITQTLQLFTEIINAESIYKSN